MLSDRNGAIDFLRLFAAIGIVWFHAKAPGGLLAYSGLSLFLFLLIALSSRVPSAENFNDFLWRRADRLLRPWLIWSVVFAIMKVIQSFLENGSIVNEFMPFMLLTGPILHLWFLPFAFACSLIVFKIEYTFVKHGSLVMIVALILGVLAVSISGILINFRIPAPFSQWSYGVCAVIFALAYRTKSSVSYGRATIFVFVAIAVFISILIFDGGADSVSIGVGIFIAMFGLSVKISRSKLSTVAGHLAMPIYLFHPVFMFVVNSVLQTENEAILAILAIILSAVAGAAIHAAGLNARLL